MYPRDLLSSRMHRWMSWRFILYQLKWHGGMLRMQLKLFQMFGKRSVFILLRGILIRRKVLLKLPFRVLLKLRSVHTMPITLQDMLQQLRLFILCCWYISVLKQVPGQLSCRLRFSFIVVEFQCRSSILWSMSVWMYQVLQVSLSMYWM